MDDKPETIPVELVADRPEWAAIAESEAARLKAALGNVLVRVHHIGSTAIPGIMAKPIVDLIPVVTDIAALDAAEQKIRKLGYSWYGEYGLEGRRFCTLTDRETGKRTVQLHCYAVGDASIPRHLAFRDYLRAHPKIAKEYEAEKIRAAARAPHDTNAYNDEKNDWIKRVERQALDWAGATRPPAP